jgi:plasmid stabilization system protein ParE
VRRIVWTDEARAGLVGIQAYIDQFNPSAAQRLGARLVAAAESLADYPDVGRRVQGRIRELTFVRPYVIRYTVLEDRVVILRIRHGARRPD